jgi:hypothetical protein
VHRSYSCLLVLEPDGLEISTIFYLLGASCNFLPIRRHAREGKELHTTTSENAHPLLAYDCKVPAFPAIKILLHQISRMELLRCT